MQLQLLSAPACLTIYYDATSDCLFLDWAGKLTLSAVQEACVAVAQCYTVRPYSRVLSSTRLVTDSESRVGPWLRAEFFLYLAVTGVQQVAWVSAPSLQGRHLAQSLGHRLPGLALAFFDTIEAAFTWLQQPMAAPAEALFSSRPTTTHVRLAQGVEVIRQEMRLVQQEVQLLQQKVVGRPTASQRP
ncbi:hypothetical protein FNT36_04190 [Hymenobacter setariae]|uniref:STAS/SEC14 domain-containing protein n=1 Tax=Hymenobacter setariae TaxID=2594794 RepID=A0A558C3N1_9BACT|nr:hypothetical protein [Hymenobacter setariae]TVT43297.1 hypothetical protein FNT36_04190 [Hymenobacter setariae]